MPPTLVVAAGGRAAREMPSREIATHCLRSPSGFTPPALGRRLLRAGQTTAAEDEVALRTPGPVRVLLEQAETVDPEVRLVAPKCGEGAVERVGRQVVRHGHVRVVREVEVAVKRTAAHLRFEPLALADALHEGHEHDRRHGPE